MLEKTYTPFPRTISNSTLDTFKSCEKKFEWATVQLLQPKDKGPDLFPGGAFAAGQAAFRDSFYGENPNQHNYRLALHAAMLSILKYWGTAPLLLETNKSLINVILAIDAFYKNWPPRTDYLQPLLISGKPATELYFSTPLEINHPTTNEPLLYTGRLDALMHWSHLLIAEDDKTTKSLGYNWAASWNLDSQFTGYKWALEQQFPDREVAAIVIRGTCFLKKSFTFAESIQYRARWEIDRWYQDTHRIIEKSIAAWREGYYESNLGSSCKAYGGCPYTPLCSSHQPERWLDKYTQRENTPEAEAEYLTKTNRQFLSEIIPQ